MSDQSAAADTVVPAPPPVRLPVRGDRRAFPVHRIYCVGRNYADHAVEMGHEPDKQPPFFFQKNPDNLLCGAAEMPYPPATAELHHEIELMVALQDGGRDIPTDRALAHVYGYAVALDMTRRDLQAQAKKLGRPWEVGKAFEHSAPCGPVVPAAEIGHPAAGAITLEVNGARRQAGDLAQMIWKVPEMIQILSTLFTLRPGDLIMTGTPAGVGAVQPGDRLHGRVEGVGKLEIAIG
jgi:fumarylpyruvate hydrolase